jgi:hypothetical protein
MRGRCLHGSDCREDISLACFVVIDQSSNLETDYRPVVGCYQRLMEHQGLIFSIPEAVLLLLITTGNGYSIIDQAPWQEALR